MTKINYKFNIGKSGLLLIASDKIMVKLVPRYQYVPSFRPSRLRSIAPTLMDMVDQQFVHLHKLDSDTRLREYGYGIHQTISTLNIGCHLNLKY